MEGLIPMVFKAIKKNKTRRKYECLSPGEAQSYNISDFYVNGQNPVYMSQYSTEKVHEEEYGGHRRHKSVGDFYIGYSTGNDRANNGVASPPQMPKQLVRFRSHRMFSCVTGA